MTRITHGAPAKT
jgi:hypothetical protein